MIAVTVGSFFLLALLGVPIAFSLGLAAVAGLSYADWNLVQLAGKVMNSIDSFPLMAIPLFVLSGELMLRGQVMAPLINLANAVVGRLRGGLAVVAVVATMILSSLSGVAVADATAIGGTLGRPLAESYGKTFSAALVAVASCMGPIIPPSAALILYAIMVGEVSVASLFLGGIIPGAMIGLLLIVYSLWIARRRGFPLTGEAFSLRGLLVALRKALVFLGMPILVLGGIIGGAFTATEGASIAAIYALALGVLVTRKLTFSDILRSLVHAGTVSAVVGALIAFSSVVTHIFTINHVGSEVAALIGAVSEGPMVLLLLVGAVLLLLGMFIEGNSLIIMTAPILAPVALSAGVDPVHFGVVFVFSIVLGILTPPVGILLFVVSSIWSVDVRHIMKEVLPMLGLLLAILLFCILVPQTVTYLPSLVLGK